MALGRLVKREVRVALSRRAQPLWFRLLKWVVILTVGVRYWGHPYFWWWVGGALALGLTVHGIWRWKTHGWTRPWGGWDDVDAAGPD